MTTERAKKSAEQEAIGFLIDNQAHIHDLQSRLQAAEQRVRKFESLEAHLPPGFAIGDDATAALAIKLVEAEQRVGELRQLVTDLHDFTKDFSGRKVDVLNRRAEKALAAKAK
jgi:hypothetical protein